MDAVVKNRAIALGSVVVATIVAGMSQAQAYIFTSTGVSIESTDVSSVTSSSMQAVGTQFEVLKFLGLFLLIGAAGYILDKVLGIRIGGGGGR